tara:strand:+ start:96 stop:1295 length:1200 start_codon:yes stop_codon:yes gene_type:complete
MNFILTKYIYPTSEKLVLSEKMNFTLDNPRSKEEIEVVKANLEKSLNSPEEFYEDDYYANLPVYNTDETKDYVTIENTLTEFEKNYGEKDSYVKEFFKKESDSDVIEKLAKMWIIGRFDDAGEYERMAKVQKEMIEKGEKGFFRLDKGNPIVDNSDNLVSYAHLISLLVHTQKEHYYGGSFFLHNDNFSLQRPKIDRFLNQTVLLFSFSSVTAENNHEEDKWKSFLHIRNDLKKVCEKVDSIIDETNKEKLLFISNLLFVAGEEIKDVRYKLVTLVSVIELLLTHSPNYNRFNVEDSISKQFKLKTSILVYQNNNKIDLDNLKLRLRDIYNQRSNIAHGNFKSLDKYLESEVKKEKLKDADIDKTIILERLVSDVYSYIRAILEEYIKDKKLVEYIKEN